ncbi:ATP-binding protein [Kitasatospora sp. DSM 101779]|uniref:ATP-binding protein n=1 Tax=Kitasatospora sp. DSM 101779 TaxID=2853165 RepID=UPI0021D8B890|nr:ATP-binding protein [Kitasatospora sp. DSM 101779]MCU7826816.1 ATP-binding protein [Kitasatospora sp. DSM 101779]
MTDDRAGLPDHRVRHLLPGQEHALATAMAFVRQTLDDWYPAGRDRPETTRVREDAFLVADELVANACAHSSGPTRLDLDRVGRRLSISVTDGGSAPPVLRRPRRPDTPTGHGLQIVDRVALRWGHRPVGGGKTVWAEVLPPLAPVNGVPVDRDRLG